MDVPGHSRITLKVPGSRPGRPTKFSYQRALNVHARESQRSQHLRVGTIFLLRKRAHRFDLVHMG